MDHLLGNVTNFQLIVCSFRAILPIKVQPTSTIFNFFGILSKCLVVLTVLTAATNFLVIVTIWRTTSLWSKLYYKGLMFMSATDFLTGITTFPLSTFFYWSQVTQGISIEDFCKVWTVMILFGYVLTGLSLDGVLFVTIERYQKICHATTYHIIVNNRRALSLVLILCSKTVISLMLLLTTDSLAISGYFFFCFVSLYVLMLTYMYYKIFMTVRNSQARVDSTSEGSHEAHHMREQRLAKKFVFIILALLFCFTPFGVVISYWMDRYDEEWVHVALASSTFLVLLNSFLNPCIYIWQDSVLRKSLASGFCLHARRHRVTAESTSFSLQTGEH